MADAGDAEAQCEVAEWFLQGHGVPRDDAKGIAWLTKAAEQGFAQAMYQLASLYEAGSIVGRDIGSAVRLYRRAAEAEHPEAQYRLARAYMRGEILPKDEREAERWLEQAAAQEHLQAMFDLADGWWDVEDYASAVPLLEKAAVRGHARAQCRLSVAYENGWGVPMDDEKALHWLRRSARQCDPWAEGDLGERFRDGRGVQRDEARAVYWLRRANVHCDGNEEARLELAELLRRRGSSEADLKEAAYWYLRGAIDGHSAFSSLAAYKTGYSCEFGVGVPQSDILALKWYFVAAERGSEEARQRLAALCASGRGFRGGDWCEAAETLCRAARAGVPDAAEALERLKGSDARAAAYSELLDLIGMAEVKETARKFVDMVRVDQLRRARGLPVSVTSLHCVFSGPPGTGKTTVARILGKLLGALGLLSSGHLREVDRAGLVGRYVGETAQKVAELIQDAMGGVLFIDEAYQLSRSDNPSDYGYEAIDTLVKRMEDHRSNLVVIVAGYEDEMESFLRANTGLESRFPWRFKFPHCSPDALQRLFQAFASGDGIQLDPACSSAARAHFAKQAGMDRSFGNGRYVRNYYEKAKTLQAQRLSRRPGNLTNDQLQTLLQEDLPLDRPL